jgi:hypothetical protein
MSSGFNEISGDFMWIKWLQIVLGSFSIAGSSLIILIFLTNLKKITPTPAFELIVQLSVSSLINTISHLILFIPPNNPTYNKTTCLVQGFSMLFSELSILIISTMISFYIWRTKAVSATHEKFNSKERIICLLINYVTPLLISSACINAIGENGKWCWIDKKFSTSLALLDYLAAWILIIMNIIFACLTMKITNENLHSEEIKNRKEYVKKLSRYPMISFLCWIPATTNRIISMLEYVNNTDYDLGFYFEIVNIILFSIQGLLYAIVSFTSVESGKNLKYILSKLCCVSCCKKKIDDKPHDDLTEYLSVNDKRMTTVYSRNNSISVCGKSDQHNNNEILN